MKVAVVGLGMEGKMAINSLLEYGHQVYASDINIHLDISMDDFENRYEIDLGPHNWDKINQADAVVLSPSLWRPGILENIQSDTKIFSNIFNKHRELFTIGVTGTNGKTTTALMINDILEKSGHKVLIGGNAGGGFDGYTKLMLEASKNNYNYLIVEVCDMTLDFCDYNFDFDLMVVTNLGVDHVNVHKTMTQYQESVREFLNDKTAVLNKNDVFLSTLGVDTLKSCFFNTYTGDLDLMAKFNRENAAAAAKVAEILNIPEATIKESLASFKGAEGRITQLNLDGSKVVVGKTDNASAITALFQEMKFDLTILGTPRKQEYWRFDIFREVANSNPEYVGLFPGLDNTTIQAREELRKNGFNGEIKIFNNVFSIVEFILSHYKNYKTIFIGGNGQDKITEIKNSLKRYHKES